MKHLLLLLLFLIPLNLLAANTYSGYTEPFNDLELTFPESGVISEINVKEGDHVKKGDLLASLNLSVLKADLAVATQKARLRYRRLEKIEALNKDGRITPDELDRARSEYAIEKYTVDRIKAQIARRTLRSVINGIVTDIYKEVSEGVAGIETPVMDVVQIDKLVLNLFVDFEDAKKIELGSQIEVHFENETKPAMAKITFISPDADKASRTVRVKLSIDNPKHEFSSGILGKVIIQDKYYINSPAKILQLNR